MNLSLKIIILINLVTIVCGKNEATLNLPLGKLEGYEDKTINGRHFYSFEGVPYAEPPLGAKRFEKPQPISGWNDTWTAKTIFICLQYSQVEKFWTGDYRTIGEEDCLYLNIYTATLNQTKNLDVIVYIHGGAFMTGYGAETRPNYILDEDVVFVTINYRLGPLGFLSTEDETVPGNNGIWDQIEALKFVKKYIKYFGGNPNSVTIDGCSAGGVSVHTHFLSPQSNNLFHKGIARSGTPFVYPTITRNSSANAWKLGRSVGCAPGNSSAELIACLRKKPGRQIVGAVKEFLIWFYNPVVVFGLVVDSYAQDPILPEHPYMLIKKGLAKNAPIIFSYADTEGTFPGVLYYNDMIINDLNSRWDELIPLILGYKHSVKAELLVDVNRKIRKHYLGDEQISKQNYLKFLRLLSDGLFKDAIRKGVYYQTKNVASDVFLYYFAYQGAHTTYDGYFGKHKEWGSGHYEDVPYIYPIYYMNTKTTAEDRDVTKIFVKMCASFAKTGKPDSFLNVTWPSVGRNVTLNGTFQALKIGAPDDVRVIDLGFENFKFWNSLPIMENEKLFPR